MRKLRNSKAFVLLAFLACLTLLLPMVAIAGSDNPNKPVDDSRSFDDLNSFLCPFPIHVDIIGKTKANLSADGLRGVTVFPGEHAVIRNLTNDKQVKLNIAGSYHDVLENGIVKEYLDGRSLAWDEHLGLVLIVGHWYWEFEYLGSYEIPGPEVTPLTQLGGNSFGVCEMIADSSGGTQPTSTPTAPPPPPPAPTPTPTAPTSPLPTPTPTEPPPPAP